MRNTFTLDGVNSSSLGVYISGYGTYNSPAKVYDLRTVPGRNGALVGLERRMENVDLTYHAFICRDFAANLEALRAFLLSREGYVRLYDSYHPGEFRMALFQGPLDVDVAAAYDAGQFDLVFNCKPQRYLTSGESVTTLTASSGSITNPTRFPSRPLLRVYGSGKVTIGSTAITISTTDPYTDIDCDAMDASYNGANRNGSISLNTNDFPALESGANGITLANGVTKVEVTPRWYTV